MIGLMKPLALAVALCLGGIAAAQEATTPDPATAPATPAPATAAPATTEPAAPTDTPAPDGLTIGQEVPTDGVGSTYTQEVFTDWEQRCVRTEQGNDPCQLYQLLKDADGNAVAEVMMFSLPPGQAAVAGATIVTPLETLLTEELVIQIDTGKAKRYPFSWCTVAGCVARVGFTAEDVAALKAGAQGKVTIVPVAAPDKTVDLVLSLKGFTAGFDAVAKLVTK